MPYAKPSVTGMILVVTQQIWWYLIQQTTVDSKLLAQLCRSGFIDTQALRERLQVVSHAASDSVMMPRLEFEIPRALGSEIDAVSPS